MNRKVLIISPHFPPINAPDHQRIRMSLPYFEEFGWEPTVLTVDPDCVEGTFDPLLAQTVPSTIQIQQIHALSVVQTRRIGLSNLAWRCLPYLLNQGGKLLSQQKFDLVYFSTTLFLTMIIAPWWQRRFQVPYILDFQDPWLSDYGEQGGYTQPPGGKFKYGFAQKLAQVCEPLALRQVSHVISVSPAYPKTLMHRYPWLVEHQFTVLPFGAPEKDFKLLPNLNVQQTIFDPQDGKRHWVYVGRGGTDMALALRALFLGIKLHRDRNPHVWESIKLHFIGTSYAPEGRGIKTIEPIAQEIGIGELVEEKTDRVPYFEALKLLTDSDGILLIGSNDPGYTASKIYPCILAQKPVLALFHQQSSVVNILKDCQVGEVISFNSENQSTDLLPQLTTQLQWFSTLPKGYEPKTNWAAFQPYTAREMTRYQCGAFDQALTYDQKVSVEESVS
ncbi:MAG: glycosyltransferase [Microcoleaceae cyanobacterium]